MECTLVRGDGSRWKVTELKLRDGRPRVWAHRPKPDHGRHSAKHWQTLDGDALRTTDRLLWRDRDGRPVWELRGRRGALARGDGDRRAAGAPETGAEVRDAVDDGFFEDSFLAPGGDARA